MPLPTAPFHEHYVVQAVRDFAAAWPQIECGEDPSGNLALVYDGRPAGSRRRDCLVATAHLDHPGLAYRSRMSDRDFAFERLGGVDPVLARGAGVRLYRLGRSPGQRSIKARVTHVGGEEFSIRIPAGRGDSVGPGSFAMWDVPALRVSGRRIRGRACDDLAGVAVGLAYLDELRRSRAPVRAGLLLTRAEEGGLHGMLAAVRERQLEDRALYVNVECSSIRAGAVLGAGPVLRVGDRLWVFDPEITGGMVAVAEEMVTEDPSFRFQRKLMDAGVCEASVLAHAGFRTGAVALPLGNYHNAGRGRLEPEVVHLDDALGLVDLLVRLARDPGDVSRGFAQTRQRLQRALTQHEGKASSRLKVTRAP